MYCKTTPKLFALDDDDDSAELIVRIAKRLGYYARGIIDPRELRHAVNESNPDVITLDLSMPNTDGLEVLGHLKEMHFAGHLLVISGHRECLRERVCHWAKVYGLQVTGHLEKPISLPLLSDWLSRLHSSILREDPISPPDI